MYTTVLLSSSLFLLHVTCTPQIHGHHGRRVCVGDAWSRRVSYSTESFLQPVHKPYITMCQNHRMCSTYKTIYRVSYRQVSRAAPNVHIYPECCPGWRRMHSHNCNQVVCEQSCANGGSCVRPNHCACLKGWTGPYCQTGGGLGLVENVTEEVQILKNRVELLEQKLEMVLAPFTTLFPLDGVGDTNSFLPERTNFLSHSLQQLDRIDSLSEQVGFLEERIGACACQEN
uniref:Epidermal growth factor-like protein 7 n=1 Tax=Sinocyclocheilus rhinocerous TaxID=307959 RepID=A0A673H0B0_9TELE